MNILHVNLNYNQSSLYKQLSNHLISNGCKHRVFYPYIKGKSINNPPYFLEQKPVLNKYDRFFFNKRNKKIVNYMITESNLKDVNLIHAHSLFSNGMVAYTFKKKYQIPYLVAVRDTDINMFFKKMIHLRKKGYKILEEADKIIFLSEPYKDYLLNKIVPKKTKEKIKHKIEVIPNGIDPFWLANINNKLIKSKSQNQNINILSVGVINRRKNLLKTAEACRIIQNNNTKVTFTIVGKIKDEDYFSKLREQEIIKYIPHVNKEELKEIYRKNDIYVMPSITESFGLVYAEAMSQGLPVLYSKGQGFDKQFEDGIVGYAVDKMKTNDIADKIQLTLDNYEYISERCIQLVDKFDWDKISQKYIKLYKKIIGD